MENKAEGEILEGFAIVPPNLEDAGLEDCALPPDSIMEAFSRAANSLRSRLVISSSQLDDDPDAGRDCVQDPGPANGQIPDALVDAGAAGEAPACGGNVTAGKVGDEVHGDDVVVVGAGDGGTATDRVVILGGDDERSCCPGEKGDVEVKKRDDAEEEGGDKELPILVESLI